MESEIGGKGERKHLRKTRKRRVHPDLVLLREGKKEVEACFTEIGPAANVGPFDRHDQDRVTMPWEGLEHEVFCTFDVQAEVVNNGWRLEVAQHLIHQARVK